MSNAALVEQAPLPEITLDHDDRTFALNAKAPLFLVQKMLPMMGRGGSIILVLEGATVVMVDRREDEVRRAAERDLDMTCSDMVVDGGVRNV